jgi:hypothetical protein
MLINKTIANMPPLKKKRPQTLFAGIANSTSNWKSKLPSK